MAKYLVNSPLNHDNQDFPVGSEVELTDDQAASLQPIGVVGETASASGQGKPKAADLIEQIKAAATIEEVDAILGGDTRATVVEAAKLRRTELGQE